MEQQIIDLNEKGFSRSKISKQLGITEYQVRKILAENNIAPSNSKFSIVELSCKCGENNVLHVDIINVFKH